MAKTMLRIVGGGDKPTAQAVSTTGKSRTADDDTADIRDILSNMVGKRISNLSDENTRADFSRLQAMLGPEKAQKLVTQVIIHNQRNPNAPMEKSIQDFYEVGSNDPDVNQVLKTVKTFGYGVLPGFRESSKSSIQHMTGRVPMGDAAMNNEDMKQRVMLRLPK